MGTDGSWFPAVQKHSIHAIIMSVIVRSRSDGADLKVGSLVFSKYSKI